MINKLNPTVAIIDSGIGGVAVLKQIISKYKAGNYIYFADNLYMPYGNKNRTWLNKRVNKLVKLLNEKYKVDLIIIACNTASTCVDENDYKNVITMKFNKNLTYFTTSLTKKNLPKNNVIDDKNLAKLIEKNIFNKEKLDKIIQKQVKIHMLDKQLSFVLGCTHFELVYEVFKKYCPKSEIENNSMFLIQALELLIKQNDLNVAVLTTKNDEKLRDKIKKLLN